jgi:hypothetical protein
MPTEKLLHISLKDITSDKDLQLMVSRGHLSPNNIPDGIEDFPEAVRYLKDLLNVVYVSVVGEPLDVVYAIRERKNDKGTEKLDKESERRSIEIYKTGLKLAEDNISAIDKRMAEIESETTKTRQLSKEYIILSELLGRYVRFIGRHNKDFEKEYKAFLSNLKGGSDVQ